MKRRDLITLVGLILLPLAAQAEQGEADFCQKVGAPLDHSASPGEGVRIVMRAGLVAVTLESMGRSVENSHSRLRFRDKFDDCVVGSQFDIYCLHHPPS